MPNNDDRLEDLMRYNLCHVNGGSSLQECHEVCSPIISYIGDQMRRIKDLENQVTELQTNKYMRGRVQ